MNSSSPHEKRTAADMTRNTALIPGTVITWLQYPTRAAKSADHHETNGTRRSGMFWSQAPDRAVWVKPASPAAGEPSLIKVYRRLRSGLAEAYAYSDDLGVTR